MTTLLQEFLLPVVLSVATGRGVDGAEFPDVHGCITHVLGWDVFTHELAQKSLWDAARAAICRAVPALTTALESEPVDNAEFVMWTAPLLETLPAILTLPRGDGRRTEDPMASLSRLAPNATVIPVIVPDVGQN